MADFRSLLHRLHASNLLAWEDMLSDIAREVREALADELAPVTTTTDGKPLPCPFCGSPDVDARTMPYVRCMTCVAFGPDATDDADGPALWNTRAALPNSTPSSAPTDSGAEPARGEAVSARACWDCRHQQGRQCAHLGTLLGQRYADHYRWMHYNVHWTGEPVPDARNCPGWAPREAGEVSDG